MFKTYRPIVEDMEAVQFDGRNQNAIIRRIQERHVAAWYRAAVPSWHDDKQVYPELPAAIGFVQSYPTQGYSDRIQWILVDEWVMFRQNDIALFSGNEFLENYEETPDSTPKKKTTYHPQLAS